MNRRFLLLVVLIVYCLGYSSAGVSLAAPPRPDKFSPVKLFEVGSYTEGIVFDRRGRGYVSEGKQIIRFTLDGRTKVWAETGAPNGHKILADGTHLVCDGSQHAVLHLASDGGPLPHAATECDGKPLRAPNDLTLDVRHVGFYFTDPGGSGRDRAIGTVHYVDAQAKTHLVSDGLAFPNGIVLSRDGKKIFVAESQRNRVLVYEVLSPGRVGQRGVFADLPRRDSAAGQIADEPDGMCLDAQGHLYVAHCGMREVQVLDPSGKTLARLPAGNLRASNVAFGGPRLDQLFVTGGTDSGRGALFRLDLYRPGLPLLPANPAPPSETITEESLH